MIFYLKKIILETMYIAIEHSVNMALYECCILLLILVIMIQYYLILAG